MFVLAAQVEAGLVPAQIRVKAAEHVLIVMHSGSESIRKCIEFLLVFLADEFHRRLALWIIIRRSAVWKERENVLPDLACFVRATSSESYFRWKIQQLPEANRALGGGATLARAIRPFTPASRQRTDDSPLFGQLHQRAVFGLDGDVDVVV